MTATKTEEPRIEYVELSELQKWPKNPKRHDLDFLGEAFEENGFVEPPILDEKSGKLVAGNGRLEKLEKMRDAGERPPTRIKVVDGKWYVPVVRGMKLRRPDKHVVASNRAPERGGWENAILAEVLSAFGKNDLAGTGFGAGDYASFLTAAGEGGPAPNDPDAEWKGMPSFQHEDLQSWKAITVHFKRKQDYEAFGRLIKQSLTENTRSIWFPPDKIGRIADKRYRAGDDEKTRPRYPIYVPTKGRAKTPLTIKTLEELGVPYYAVIQPQELEEYKPVVKTGKILLLPEGLDGLVPARNWIRDHSINVLKAKRHWQIDDNIDGFYRFNRNLKVKAETPALFRAMEDFCDRYENIAFAGPNYFMFAPRKSAKIKPVTLNTRVYSCTLANNELDFRWRDVYNDDTDINLRALKEGFCTVLFNAFLCMKATTMSLKGGNTSIYQGDGRRKMAESLKRQHPDVTTVTKKWGRYQHHVDYRPFKANQLKLRPGVKIPAGTDEFGMALERVVPTSKRAKKKAA